MISSQATLDPTPAGFSRPPVPQPNPPSNIPHPASPLPTLSPREQQLLSLFASSNFHLPTLAREGVLTPHDLAAFAASPSVQSHIASLVSIAQSALLLRAAEARRTAIEELEKVTRNSADDVEKRRAATQLLRATSAPLVGAPSSDAAPRRCDPVPFSPRPIARPNPSYTPHQVANLLVHALRSCDEPEEGSGAATLAAFSIPGAAIDTKPLPTAPDDAGQVACDIPDAIEAIEDSALSTLRTCTKHWPARDHAPATDRAATVPIIISHNGATSTVTFQLARNPEPPHAGCWLVEAISTGRANTS